MDVTLVAQLNIPIHEREELRQEQANSPGTKVGPIGMVHVTSTSACSKGSYQPCPKLSRDSLKGVPTSKAML